MKRIIMSILFTMMCLSLFSQEKEFDETRLEQPRKGDFRLSGDFMLPILPGFSSLGMGAHYGMGKQVDLYGELSILPYPLSDASLYFHSTLGGRFYFSKNTNALYIEAGGGVFGGMTNYSPFGVTPLITSKLGYEFELKRFVMDVDLGVFCIIGTMGGGLSYFALPLPTLSTSIFF